MNVRQFSYVLLAVLISASMFVQCNSTQASAASDPDAGTAAVERAAHQLIECLESGEDGTVLQYLPDASMARILAPDNTGSLSDAEIEAQMLAPLRERFSENLTRLRQAIVEQGLSPNDLSLEGHELYPSEDPPLVPRVMGVTFRAGKQSGVFPVTYLQHEGRVYLFEILKTTGIFK